LKGLRGKTVLSYIDFLHIIEEKNVERYMKCLGKRIEIETGQL